MQRFAGEVCHCPIQETWSLNAWMQCLYWFSQNAPDLLWEGPTLSCGNLLRKPFTPSRKPSGSSSSKAVYILRAEDDWGCESARKTHLKHFHNISYLLNSDNLSCEWGPSTSTFYQEYDHIGYQVLLPLPALSWGLKGNGPWAATRQQLLRCGRCQVWTETGKNAGP